MIHNKTLVFTLPLLAGLAGGVCWAAPQPATVSTSPQPIVRQSAQMLPYAGAVGMAGGATAGTRPVMPGAAAVPGATAGSDRETASDQPPIDPAYTAGAAVLTKAERNDYDLLSAAYAGETWKVREALSKGARLDARDSQNGFTPLMWAASNGQVGAVRYLLEKGAKPNVRSQTGVSIVLAAGPQAATPAADDASTVPGEATYIVARRGGVTPLILASAHGYAVTVRELLKRGADPNLASPEGITAMTCAAFKGYLPSVEALLAKGARVNARDVYNGYPLMMAAVQGNTDIVRALLAKGARVNLGASNGWTPLEIARAYGHTAVVRLLKRAGATEKMAAAKAQPRSTSTNWSAPPVVSADPGAPANGIIVIP